MPTCLRKIKFKPGGMKGTSVYISKGSCVRASRPFPRACTSVFVLRTLNPLMPGPRGCLRTPWPEDSFKFPLSEPVTLEGRLGTGGKGPEVPKVPLPKRDPKPPGERRDGEAMVAYPSRMFPLDARVVRRGACICKVFMSGIDFFMRRVLAS